MKTREEALEYGLSFPDTYRNALPRSQLAAWYG